MLTRSQPIWSSVLIQERLRTGHNLELPRSQICQFMRKQLRLGYRKASPVPIQANSERCLVLRQQYAIRMIGLLLASKRIINIDESWVNQTQYNRRMWAPSTSPATVTGKMIAPRLSLIAALDTDGRVYFSLLHANTDSDIMMLFMTHLFRQLDAETPDWK